MVCSARAWIDPLSSSSSNAVDCAVPLDQRLVLKLRADQDDAEMRLRALRHIVHVALVAHLEMQRREPRASFVSICCWICIISPPILIQPFLCPVYPPSPSDPVPEFRIPRQELIDRDVVRAVAGEVQSDDAVEDVDRAGAQVDGVVGETQMLEGIQDGPHLVLRDHRSGG